MYSDLFFYQGDRYCTKGTACLNGGVKRKENHCDKNEPNPIDQFQCECQPRKSKSSPPFYIKGGSIVEEIDINV